MKTLNKIITHGGVTLNMATLKCFKVSSNSDIGKTNVMVVEHKTRIEFIQHPKTGEYEKQEFNEKTEVEYPSFELAQAYRKEWEEIWQDYLDEQL